MSNIQGSQDSTNTVALEKLPKTALQAIYHAVTGKTENLTKGLYGNVVIASSDIEQLHLRISQQIEHYELEFPPTVSIIVK